MKRKLSPEEKELFNRIDEGLYYVWDPIGINDEPYARDEYSSYVPQVFDMVMNSSSKRDIAHQLSNIPKEMMGLSRQAGKTKEATALLLQWRKKLFDDGL